MVLYDIGLMDSTFQGFATCRLHNMPLMTLTYEKNLRNVPRLTRSRDLKKLCELRCGGSSIILYHLLP